MNDELRQAVRDVLDTWDARLQVGMWAVIEEMEDLRAVLAKNANAAPQDQDAKDAARYRMARFKGTISDGWQESLDHWIALNAALAAMKEQKP